MKCNICGGNANQTIIIYLCIFSSIMLTFIGASCCCGGRKGEGDRAGLITDDGLAASRLNFPRRQQTASIAHGHVENARDWMTFMRSLKPYVKILVAYLQIVGGISFGFDLQMPPVFTSLMTFAGSVVNLDFINLMPLGCITNSNFHRQLLGMTLMPSVLGAAMVLAYKSFKAVGRKVLANEIFR